MLYAIAASVVAAFVSYWILKFAEKYIPGVFVSKDGRPYGEPVMLTTAFIFDYFVGKSGFTTFLGWWFFLYVLQALPRHIYGNMLLHIYGEEYCSAHCHEYIEWCNSHRAFVYFIYYALFLSFWWKWI